MTTDTRTLEWLVMTHPQMVSDIIDTIDTEDAEMDELRTALEIGDDLAACRSLLDFYRQRPMPFFSGRRPISAPFPHAEEADDILDDQLTLYEVRGHIPRRSDGGWQWDYNGPEGDREWGWGLNRHYHLATLYNAWLRSGRRAYLRRLDEQLRDWILNCPYPGQKSNSPMWRGLEVFSRLRIWAELFHRLIGHPDFSPSTLALMLYSIPQHADYLEHFHAAGGNWITMEMNGLAIAATAWPQYLLAPQWIEYAEEQMLPQIDLQVYPDGTQKELTSSYHHVALMNFESFAEVVRASGSNVSEAYQQALVRMWDYLARSMRPGGFGPLNNDSDYSDYRTRVVAAAKRYERPDWLWYATRGRQGAPPQGPSPSAIFPWAGQLIMRSGPQGNDHWAFFDAGPLGIGHWHYDKLHLSVRCGGRDVLVDSGRYTYVQGQWRDYFIGTAGHNTILLDGCPQQAEAREVDEPLSEADYQLAGGFDFIRSTFDAGYQGLHGTAAHTRAVVYLRGSGWIVLDRIRTDRQRTIEVLWHFHPDCTVALDGQQVSSVDARKGNLRITPLRMAGETARPALVAGSAASTSVMAGHIGPQWAVSLIRGQVEPEIQGWYSRCYGLKTPSTCAGFRATVDGDVTFGWLLTPGRNTPPRPVQADLTLREADTLAMVTVEWPEHPARTIRIPLIAGKAEIVE